MAGLDCRELPVETRVNWALTRVVFRTRYDDDTSEFIQDGCCNGEMSQYFTGNGSVRAENIAASSLRRKISVGEQLRRILRLGATDCARISGRRSSSSEIGVENQRYHIPTAEGTPHLGHVSNFSASNPVRINLTWYGSSLRGAIMKR